MVPQTFSLGALKRAEQLPPLPPKYSAISRTRPTDSSHSEAAKTNTVCLVQSLLTSPYDLCGLPIHPNEQAVAADSR